MIANVANVIDQEVRQAASRDLSTSWFLEAGAGTGKTRVLVDRVAEIVRQGKAEIQQVLVITFTEKAAGELRARIREALHSGHDESKGQERQRYYRALQGQDEAHIETIHAFASSILRERPLEARIDPNFRQLDEIGDELDFEERWRDWLSGIDGDDLSALERCLDLGLPLRTIRGVARDIGGFREVGVGSGNPPVPDAPRALAELLKKCDALLPLTAQCTNTSDQALAAFHTVRDELKQLEDHTQRQIEHGLGNLVWKSRRPRRANWRDRADSEAFLLGLEGIAEALEACKSTLRQAAIARLVPTLAGFVQASAAGRIGEGELNFEDLLIEARNLVRKDASVRRYLRERYRYILVDEFQDTDPLQAEIVFLMAGNADGPEGNGRWQDVAIAPGKLFLVGDPKQSIYRFRRADIDAFETAVNIFRRHVKEGLPVRVERLFQNFRSVPSVVHWVNELFSIVISKNENYPASQPEYTRIEPFRPDDGPRVVHLYPRGDLRDEKMADVRAAEADAIARLAVWMAGATDWMMSEDPQGVGPRRPLTFADICILVETRTSIDLYTEALGRYAVPYTLDGGRDFFERQEVRDVGAILRALDDPSDQVSLVAALKSEAYTCADDELLQFRVKGGRFDLLSPGVEDGPVAEALRRLRSLYDQKARLGLPSFIDLVVRDSFLVETRLLSGPERQRAANLKLIVQRAMDFASNGVDSLRPFIRWLSDRQQAGSRVGESQINETDDNVVRIMTVHGAKGLEFPVVILAKMAGAEAPGRHNVVVDRDAGRLEFEVGPADRRFCTPGFERAWVKESIYQEAEARRLLYVAATRARDYLVVPRFLPEKYPGKHAYLGAVPSWNDVAGQQERPTFAGAQVIFESDLRGEAAKHPPATEVLPDLAARWMERSERIHGLIAQGPSFVVPSQLAADETKEPRETEPKDRSEDERDSNLQAETQRALGATSGAEGLLFVASAVARQRGSLVHEVLFRSDFNNPASVAAWTQRLCRERGALGLATEVSSHVDKILTSRFMGRVNAARRIIREMPVASFDGETYIEGFVDLAFEEPGGWVIVDYKTDQLDGRLEELQRRYDPQIRAYARALSAAGVPVKEVGLWFSATGECATFPVSS